MRSSKNYSPREEAQKPLPPRSGGQTKSTARSEVAGGFFRLLAANTRGAVNLVLLAGYCAAWLYELAYWFPKDAYGNGLNYWAFTDWLIDYSQGFIRRGLSGELWNLFSSKVPAVAFVAVLSWGLMLIAAFGYARLLARSWKTMHPLTMFGLLFLPSLFVFYQHDHNAIARKEVLGTVTVLLHLLIVEKSLPLGSTGGSAGGSLRRYVSWLIPLNLIVLPAVILVHEANFLLFVPLHGMITLSMLSILTPRGRVKAALWSALLYLPAALTLAGVYLSGTPSNETLLGICEKWLAAGVVREGSCVLPPEQLSGSTLPASLIPMAWTLKQAAAYTRMIVLTNLAAWLVILPVLGACLWYLARQALYMNLRSRAADGFSAPAAKRFGKRFFVLYFLIPLACALPIYFTAYDYGRWFTVTCVNFAMVVASLNLPVREFVVFKSEGAGETREHLDSPAVFLGVSILICVLALVLWLPHYCIFRCDIVRSPLEYFAHTFVVN